MGKRKQICLIVFLMVLPSLMVGYFAMQAYNASQNTKTPAPFKEYSAKDINLDALRNMSILYVSTNNTMPEIIDELQSLGINQINYADPQELFSNSTFVPMNLNESTLLIFDIDWISKQTVNWVPNETGNWFSNRTGNWMLFNYLLYAYNNGERLTAIGGSTSTFFEALDEAGVYKIAQSPSGNFANPASRNPPLVGIMLKQASRPDGSLYWYPSILTCNSPDPEAMVKSLTEWLGE